MSTYSNLQPTATDVFWGEIAPCDHLVQIYEDDRVFLDTLEGYVSGGLRAGDSAVVIATPAHRRSLEERLKTAGIDLDAARSDDRYIDVDAEELLAKFMARGWPDDQLFVSAVTEIITRAKGSGRKVRAFGEMVAVLWARGDQAATIRLEHLWHQVCETDQFSLFCAYPRVGFTQDASESINQICEAHSKVVPW